jgi:hypothetical protein
MTRWCNLMWPKGWKNSWHARHTMRKASVGRLVRPSRGELHARLVVSTLIDGLRGQVWRGARLLYGQYVLRSGRLKGRLRESFREAGRTIGDEELFFLVAVIESFSLSPFACSESGHT